MKTKKNLIFILISLQTTITSLIIPLTNPSPGLFAVSLSIGYPKHDFLLLIDTTSDYTWVRGTNCTFCSYTENIYNEKESISVIYPTNYPFITISDIRGTVSGVIALDDVKLDSFYVNKLEILIASEDEFLEFVDGVLGLDIMRSSGNNNLLIFKLYQNGSIKQRVFSINIKEEMSATMSIGEIPSHILNDKDNYSTCKIRNENNNWNCLVTHILFGDDFDFYNAIKLDNAITNFSTGVNGIYIPINLIDLFLDNYFKKLPNFNSQKCFIKKSSNTKHILCQKNFLNFKGPSISFIINGYAYFISFEDLFEDVYSDSYNQYKIFKIEFTDTPKNELYFGTLFLKQSEVVFDAEKMEVGFYSKNKVDFTKFTNEHFESFCWYNTISILVLLFILVGPMIITLYHQKISSKHFNDLKNNNLNKEK